MIKSRNRPESSRDDRRARALRENLKRRKAQARGRAGEERGEKGEKGETAAQNSRQNIHREPRDLPRDAGSSGRQDGLSRKD
jgi:hypothetical protein